MDDKQRQSGCNVRYKLRWIHIGLHVPPHIFNFSLTNGFAIPWRCSIPPSRRTCGSKHPHTLPSKTSTTEESTVPLPLIVRLEDQNWKALDSHRYYLYYTPATRKHHALPISGYVPLKNESESSTTTYKFGLNGISFTIYSICVVNWNGWCAPWTEFADN